VKVLRNSRDEKKYRLIVQSEKIDENIRKYDVAESSRSDQLGNPRRFRGTYASLSVQSTIYQRPDHKLVGALIECMPDNSILITDLLCHYK
jgi:hypothetical protein